MSGWIKKWRGIAVVGCVVVGLWLCNLFILYDNTGRGTYGDMFGAVNALFSGLAFAGVVIAILLQKEELALQRNELEMTRYELEGQKEQLEEQCNIFQNQRFDDNFFQLIQIYNNIVSEMSEESYGPVGNSRVRGKECFVLYYKSFRDNIADNNILRLPDYYSAFYKEWQQSIAHYFKILYGIINYVHTSGIDDKRMYIDIICAQLSTYEQLLLFYNSLSNHGHEKFRPFVEKYGLLQNIDASKLINIEHKREFADSAYGVL